MPRKQQSRGWIYASVAAVLLLVLWLKPLQHEQLFQSLQQHFSEAGITFKAKHASLSWMYMGAIRLDDVEVVSPDFELHAQRMFIDLDLAALLTGKALAQALYLQFAEINILQNKEGAWLKAVESNHVKLKRIDISQSEIHFEEQHITLNQVDLDIRDIGRNKNPRLELRAHIGDGRLDAHGFLRLRQGKVIRGFSRLRLHHIPLNFIPGYNLKETLTGSMTTHINQDATWQSFGHLALSQGKKNTLELRGQLTGSPEKWLNIEDMVLTVPESGAVAITGGCVEASRCQVEMRSPKIKLKPLLTLLQYDGQVQQNLPEAVRNIALQSDWQGHTLSSSGQLSWSGFSLAGLGVEAGGLEFQGLKLQADGFWQLQQAKVYENRDKSASLTLKQAVYAKNDFTLPFFFQHTPLWRAWLQVMQLRFPHDFAQGVPLQGEGVLHGGLTVNMQQDKLQKLDFDLDAKAASLQWQTSSKAIGIPFSLQGEADFAAESGLKSFDIKARLAGQFAHVSAVAHDVYIHAMNVNMDVLHASKLRLPALAQAWKGFIQGKVGLRYAGNGQGVSVVDAQLDMLQFGREHDVMSGHLEKNNGLWSSSELLWHHGSGTALIALQADGGFTLTADKLDSKALFIMQALPFLQQGSIQSHKFSFPFANVHHFSSQYRQQGDTLQLSKLKAKLNQGTWRAKWLHLSQQDGLTHVDASLQLGSVQLKRWSWLQKQLHNRATGKLYATVRLQADFDAQQQLVSWSGDGDIAVYNALWLNKAVNAEHMWRSDKFTMTWRKRQAWQASFRTATQLHHGQSRRGKGNLHRDEEQSWHGSFAQQQQRYRLSGDWLHMRWTAKPKP